MKRYSLGSVPVDASDTDGDLEKKVIAHLPRALKKAAEGLAIEAANELKKTFGTAVTVNMTALTAETHSQLQRNVAEVARIKKLLLAQLKETRDKKKSRGKKVDSDS